jgi:hypothetical protein
MSQDLYENSDQQSCRAEWGICPEHGNTLSSSGGRSWCREARCGRSWEWDRGGLHCTEPAAFRVRGLGDEPERWGPVCPGHTLAALDQLEGIEMQPLDSRTAESSVPMNDRPARPTMSVGEWRALPTGYKTVHREFGPMVLRLDPATGGTVSQAVDLQFGPREGKAVAIGETAEAGRADQEAGQEVER